MFWKKMKNCAVRVEAVPILLLIVFSTPSCISATQATAAPTTIAGRTGQPAVSGPKRLHTMKLQHLDMANGEPMPAYSLSGRPDYTLFGYNIGMEAGAEPSSALNPYLFSLPDKLKIPADSVLGRPDYTLFGLEADPAQHLVSMSGAILQHHNLVDTDRIPVQSLFGRPDYRLYGLE